MSPGSAERSSATTSEREPSETPSRRDQSTALVTIVAVFYALVLGQCLIQEPRIFLHPGANSAAALAMGVVFVGGAWEFLSYSLNMGRFPYKVRWITKSNTASEELRFAADLLVATTYGLLLIQAYGLWLDPTRGLFWFFDTLVLIDLLSLASVVLGEVQWQIPRYRIFAELPFMLLLLTWYQNEFHGPDASLNRRFLAYTIVFIFVRELLVRFAAKDHFGKSQGGEPLRQRLRRRTAEQSDVSQMISHAPRVYLAGPLGFFPYGEAFYDQQLIPELQGAGYEVLNPWDVPDDLAAVYRHAGTEAPARLAAANRVAGARNAELIDAAQAVVAILDGSDVDSGTAAEIGYAAGKLRPVPVIGLRFDTRPSGDNRGATVNLQVEHFIEASGGEIISQTQDVSSALASLLEALRALVPISEKA
jgi:nucleoside 2-deoxyribosyltransferase